MTRHDGRELFEGLADGVVVHDPDTGEILDANRAYLDMVGYDREDLVGVTVDRVSAGDMEDPAGRFDSRVRQARDGGPVQFEWRLRRADGATVPVEINLDVAPVGGVDRAVASVRDATERRERERELKTTSMKADALVSALPDVAILKDRAGNELETFARPEAESLVTEDPPLGREQTPEDVFSSGEAAERARAAIRRAIDRDTIESMEYRIDVPAGTRWFEARIAPLEEPIDGREMVAWVARDITDRKERERELESYELLFENTSDCIVEIGFVGGEPRIQGVNAAFEDVFGYTESAVVGENLDEVVAPPELDEEARELSARIREGGDVTREVTRETADGRREFLLRSVRFEEELSYVIYTDITDRKERERELRETKAKLERSNEKLERFAYVASHDLQEPVRMVSSYMDILESELADDLDEETREFMDFAVDGAERMRAMIDGLLQYSRVQTRADPFEPVDANEVLAETLQDLELLVDEAGADVRVGDLPTVEADRNQLGQVFQNLVKNAVDHGGEGVRVEVTATRREGATEFAVADDGPGIPENRREDVFDIFESGHDSDGTGIGLAVCRGIVDRHGGDLWVESTVDEGTTFRFTIPDDPG